MQRAGVFLALALNYILFFSAADPWLAALAKVAPLLWLLFWAWQAGGPRGLLAALALGGCGDVLLALDFFLAGLTAFLLGHLCYIGLWLRSTTTLRHWALLPTLLLMVAAAIWVLPTAGGMLLPVAVYLLVIAVMALLAARSRLVNGLGLIGVYSFLLSDFLLAWQLYRQPLPLSLWLIMSSYYLAQFLICLSVLQCHRPDNNINGPAPGVQHD